MIRLSSCGVRLALEEKVAYAARIETARLPWLPHSQTALGPSKSTGPRVEEFRQHLHRLPCEKAEKRAPWAALYFCPSYVGIGYGFTNIARSPLFPIRDICIVHGSNAALCRAKEDKGDKLHSMLHSLVYLAIMSLLTHFSFKGYRKRLPAAYCGISFVDALQVIG